MTFQLSPYTLSYTIVSKLDILIVYLMDFGLSFIDYSYHRWYDIGCMKI